MRDEHHWRKISGIAVWGLVLLAGCSQEAPSQAPAPASSPAGAPSSAAATTPAPQQAPVWIEDMKKAQALARKQDRPMLLNFSGSDWCYYCKLLDREVLDTSAFKRFAAERLILVELDFPRSHPQPGWLREQNRRLARQYGLKGFPTLIVLSPDGTRLGQLGYRPGGPEPFLQRLKAILNR